MNKKYLLELYNQYKNSTGMKDDNINFSDFENWLYRYNYLIDEYMDYEEEYGYKLDSPTLAEVDKGYMDSIAFDPMIIISPYADTFFLKPSKLVRLDDQTLIMIDGELLKPEGIDTFITQNPYNPLLIQSWDKMHYADGFNIGVGVYGYLDDKDKDDKLKMLADLYESLKLESSFSSKINFECDTYRDKYFSIVTAKVKEKVKGPLVKTR